MIQKVGNTESVSEALRYWQKKAGDAEAAGAAARCELALVKAALRLVIEQKAPAYHDCIDNGEPECAWCVARATLRRTTDEGRPVPHHGSGPDDQ